MRREIELRPHAAWAQVDLLSPLGLRIVRQRCTSRLFLLAADRAPWLARRWAGVK